MDESSSFVQYYRDIWNLNNVKLKVGEINVYQLKCFLITDLKLKEKYV